MSTTRRRSAPSGGPADRYRSDPTAPNTQVFPQYSESSKAEKKC